MGNNRSKVPDLEKLVKGGCKKFVRYEEGGKPKKRRSVIKRLHQKQIAIARWIWKWKESEGRICEG